uniref:Uroplakin-1b n=1 Tax=Aceria tosichella TaxID=561515 RepID=A0A6G1S5U3_9ACAR
MSIISMIGKFMSEFARLILFLASIVVLLCSMVVLAMSYKSYKDFAYIELAGTSSILMIVVCFSIYLIVLSASGIFAAFFSTRSIIKLLALMMALNVAISLVVLAGSSYKYGSLNTDLEITLKKYMEKYDWEHTNTTDPAVKKATKAWDEIQTGMVCCGIHSPDEWAAFRPADHKKEKILPKSCCFHPKSDKFCNPESDETVWTNGCVANMEFFLKLIGIMLISLVCFCFAISILAFLVLCCNPEYQYY